MEPIRFYAGQESGVIIERENFSQSVFYEKYQHAFEIFSRIWESRNDDISNIIAICGDRGEGKTSLLKTVQNILRGEEDVYERAKKVFPYPEGFHPSKVRVLDVIDPAFFDAKHNLIELLLGKMYGELRAQIRQDEKSILSTDKTQLLQQFDRVKNCLSIIRKNTDDSIYDKLEELDKLAAGMQLKEEIDKLFNLYAKHFNAERIVICIDDLDLNMSEGYQMAEEMRKYLCNPQRCIILVALKIEQMNEVIASYLRENTNKDIIDRDGVLEMANHYITKLLPLSHRVWMPSGSEIAERSVVIIDKNNQEHPYESVKDAVVWLIFQKTRYIFVNGRALSPIVPTNMRNLRHLLGTLYDMSPAKDSENKDNVENKRIFKQYFFHKWIECLNSEDYKFVSELVKINDYSLINKDVVTHLAHKFPKETDSVDEADGLLKSILDPRNTIYNISIGDVFYIMQRLDQIPININTSNLIFFIRAFYAIKLYETYDIVSLDTKHLFMEKEPNDPSIYKYDTDLQQLNMMQRLVNGSYFTYMPGDLLPLATGNNTTKKETRDIRVLDGSILKRNYSELKKMVEDNKERNEDFYKRLHLCEFFALTTTYPVKSSTSDAVKFGERRQSEILALRPANSDTKNWRFDVMSIFYNIINYKMAYEKLAVYYPDFYKLASDPECDSLLNKMLEICRKEEGGRGESALNIEMHGLISDAAVRSDTVLMAILDAVKRDRNIHKTGSNRNNIRYLYSAIHNLKITLYAPNEQVKSRYSIPFKFLEPIITFLWKTISDGEFDGIYGVKSDTQQELDV